MACQPPLLRLPAGGSGGCGGSVCGRRKAGLYGLDSATLSLSHCQPPTRSWSRTYTWAARVPGVPGGQSIDGDPQPTHRRPPTLRPPWRPGQEGGCTSVLQGHPPPSQALSPTAAASPSCAWHGPAPSSRLSSTDARASQMTHRGACALLPDWCCPGFSSQARGPRPSCSDSTQGNSRPHTSFLPGPSVPVGTAATGHSPASCPCLPLAGRCIHRCKYHHKASS